ncbi:hypothetical protein AMECASPLE_008640 [Ameca splendens]|uniref:Uncharacterized protein n=1 Tax=Ameca splendens TaxID=208324 RepID=A0ABV0Y0G1_9TELE
MNGMTDWFEAILRCFCLKIEPLSAASIVRNTNVMIKKIRSDPNMPNGNQETERDQAREASGPPISHHMCCRTASQRRLSVSFLLRQEILYVAAQSQVAMETTKQSNIIFGLMFAKI